MRIIFAVAFILISNVSMAITVCVTGVIKIGNVVVAETTICYDHGLQETSPVIGEDGGITIGPGGG